MTVNDSNLRRLLNAATTIAVVGASTNPAKAANRIPELLIKAGYTVIPVHPTATEILGQRAYPALATIGVHVDIVDVFRPGSEAAGIAEQAAAIGAAAVWLQRGITSNEARQVAKQAGMAYFEDRCIGETTVRLAAHPAAAPPRSQSEGGTTMIDHLTSLEVSCARLRHLVEQLGPDRLEGQAYPAEWSIAEVLSHIGSGAAIMQRMLTATVLGSQVPPDFAQSVWDEWDAKPALAQASGALDADQALLASVRSMTSAEQIDFRLPLGAQTVDLSGFLQSRLTEHSLHTWDIEVVSNSAASLPFESTRLIIDSLATIARRFGKPASCASALSVRTVDPIRYFEIVDDGAGVTLKPAEPTQSPDLDISAEAFIRLIYGRLDPGHTPVNVGGTVHLTKLRRMFPGP